MRSNWRTDVTNSLRRSLSEYLALEYPFNVIADEEGGYVVVFPDLPGCLTQVERIEEIPAAATEARELWIETEYENGAEIPLPSYPEEYSGKFNLRIPKSLHRRLAESAEREGVSLNQYVLSLLQREDTLARVEQKLDALVAEGQGREPSTRRAAS
jgi:antitoxin HicB